MGNERLNLGIICGGSGEGGGLWLEREWSGGGWANGVGEGDGIVAVAMMRFFSPFIFLVYLLPC